MSAIRTQVYLDESMRRRLDREAARQGRSMAEIVRLALDDYLADEERIRAPLDPSTTRWFGAWQGKAAPDISSIRVQLEKRAKRLNS